LQVESKVEGTQAAVQEANQRLAKLTKALANLQQVEDQANRELQADAAQNPRNPQAQPAAAAAGPENNG
ncbi:MAG: hypothetical protein WAM28_05380, partial [Chlamydiales bacterium]